ncbi:MAG: PqqD family protein [Actinomycetota bacterium]|nr:PqqD family protein [Actinomycetota bacterium]
MLNLETGKYHGLNPTAGTMLEALESEDSVGHAAAAIASEYDQPIDQVEHDLCELCADLVQRGLIEVDGIER